MVYQFESLLQPIRIGGMAVKNRMAMSPMNTNFSNENGSVTQQMAEYYIRRAKGGAGLITLEAASVSPDSRNHGVQPMLYDEKFIPAWSNLIEQIQSYGTKVSIEIAHFGSEAVLEPRVSASAVSRFPSETVHPLTVDEIRDLEDKFARTVMNAKLAGADAVTLHGAHGYLLAEFLSPAYNHRGDEYGGSLENRARFIVEILQKCKKAVGKRFPIIVRYSVNEFVKGGRELGESVELAKLLEKAGADAIDLSAGIPGSYLFTNPPHSISNTDCFLASYSKEVKTAVRIPVICSNGIRTPADAEKMITDGAADLVGMARTLLAEPDFCNKVRDGRAEDVRPCLSCQYCFQTLDSGKSLRCSVNAENGREYQYVNLPTAAAGKSVAVVGGGPAGMEAARIAAMRGCCVTLFEKSESLGGTARYAAIPPHKEKIAALIRWYEKALKDLKVDVRLSTEFTSETVEKLDPQAQVIFATGAGYVRRIEGSSGKNVVTATELLADPSKVGKRVVIIGGGATGCETAEFLSGGRVELSFTGIDGVAGKLEYRKEERKSSAPEHDITLVEMVDEICSDMDEYNKPVMKLTLMENGVHVKTGTMVKKIVSEGVWVTGTDGADTLLPADTVVLAGGLTPNTPDVDPNNSRFSFVGDSHKPGRIANAIYEGFVVANRL